MPSTTHLKGRIDDINFFANQFFNGNFFQRNYARRSLRRALNILFYEREDNAEFNRKLKALALKALALARYGSDELKEFLLKRDKEGFRSNFTYYLQWNDSIKDDEGEPGIEKILDFSDGFNWRNDWSDPSSNNLSDIAIANRKPDVLKRSLDFGFRPSSSLYIHYLASDLKPESAETAKILLDRKLCNPFLIKFGKEDDTSHYDQNALMIAAFVGDKKIFDHIIEYAEGLVRDKLLTREQFIELINLRELSGNLSALDYAILSDSGDESVSMIRTLIDSGADLFENSKKGNTALITAVQKNKPEVVDLIVNTLNDRVTERTLNEEKFLEYLSTKDSFGANALMLAILEGSEAMVKTLIESGADLFAKDNKGEAALIFAIAKGESEIASLIINTLCSRVTNGDLSEEEFLKYLNVQSSANSNENALSLVVGYARKEVFDILVKNGASTKEIRFNAVSACILRGGHSLLKELLHSHGLKPHIKDVNGFDLCEFLVRSEEGLKFAQETPEIFASVFGSNEELLEKFTKISRSRAALGMAYSANKFSFIYNFGLDKSSEDIFLRSQIQELEFDHRDFFIKVLDALENKTLLSFADSKSRIITMPYKNHRAFAIIDFAEDGTTPKRISFCDGNSPSFSFCEGFGEVTFDIDLTKVGEGFDFEKFINESFDSIYGDQPFDEKVFLEAVKTVAVCGEDGNPIIATKSIPCKAQKRGNCGFKSTNILFRSMLRRENPELDFSKGGSGYAAYKKYKNDFITKNLSNFLDHVEEFLESDLGTFSGAEFAASYREEIHDSLKSIMLHSIAKGKFEIADRILPILEREGIDLASVKNREGDDALFLVTDKKESFDKKRAALEWCRDHGLKIGVLEGKTQVGFFEDFKTLEFLLQNHMLDSNVLDHEGNSIIFNLIAHAPKEILQLFIDNDIDLRANDKKGITALIYAVLSDKPEIVSLIINDLRKKVTAGDLSEEEFLEYIHFQDPIGFTALGHATLGGSEKITKILIENGANLFVDNKDNITNLMTAVLGKNPEVVSLIIENLGEDVITNTFINAQNASGMSALLFAESEEIFNILIDKGADLSAKDKKGNTALTFAALSNNNKMFNLVIGNLEAKVEKEEGGLSKKQFLEYLNAKNSNGNNALLLVAYKGLEEEMNILIKNDVDLFVKDENESTVLMMAVAFNKPETVSLIINHLKEKVTEGNLSEEQFLEYLNAKNSFGHSALSFAIGKGDIVKILKDNNATIEISFEGELESKEEERPATEPTETSSAPLVLGVKSR